VVGLLRLTNQRQRRVDRPVKRRFRGSTAQSLSGKLDLEFGWLGDFSDRNRHLRVRVQSASGAGYRIFLKRD